MPLSTPPTPALSEAFLFSFCARLLSRFMALSPSLSLDTKLALDATGCGIAVGRELLRPTLPIHALLEAPLFSVFARSLSRLLSLSPSVSNDTKSASRLTTSGLMRSKIGRSESSNTELPRILACSLSDTKSGFRLTKSGPRKSGILAFCFSEEVFLLSFLLSLSVSVENMKSSVTLLFAAPTISVRGIISVATPTGMSAVIPQKSLPELAALAA
mmetsp:Transcript_41328/g.60830  ORF Transcript_41328/g.60830 Transcript_41328/m.60830 type:complete len:215 (-) Transcript_41328:92-736(-)